MNRVLIMAGGTGGHIFPALAVARELQQRGWQAEWLGGEHGLENSLVTATEIPLHRLRVRGLRGGGLTAKLKSLWMLLSALWQALRIMRRVEPDLVLGFGGYASGPGGLAAFICRKPLVIHEQNAIAGMTNRYLAKLARVTLQAFPGALAGAEVVGNPVRAEIVALAPPEERFSGRQGLLRLLVMGGSQGAHALNQQLPAALAASFTATELEVRHQCGREQHEITQSAYREAGLNAEVSEFIDDMAAAYGWADLLVCRAGALTVSEVAAAGVAAIFVPFPAAVDDHQTRNAGWLVEAGAARVIQQSELDAQTLAAALEPMRSRDALQAMALKARDKALVDSARRVATICQEQLHD